MYILHKLEVSEGVKGVVQMSFNMSSKSISLFLLVSFYASAGNAKFQYVSKLGLNRCTVCHVSPTGGGLRNSQGKAFGQHGYKVSKNKYYTQDALSADVRMIYYSPENSDKNRGGLGLMTGSLGLNLPLYETESGTESRLVYTHNLGGFGGSTPQDAYVRWRYREDSENSILPQYVLVGRFHLPFGILTDEHRTYVRMQNNSSWNDYDMGLMVSGNPFEGLHYDLGVMNGQKTKGAVFNNEGATDWGQFLNLRLNIPKLPLILGASYAKHAALKSVTASNNKDPKSFSIYGAFNFGAYVSFVPLVVTFEHHESKNWNEDSIFAARYIDPSNGYQSSVLNSTSKGQLIRFDFSVNEKLILMYKYDSLLLNKDFSGDTYVRSGFGFRYVMGPNMILDGRYEKAHGGSSVDSNVSAALQDAVIVLLQVSI